MPFWTGLVPGDGSDELHRLIARVEQLEEAHGATLPPPPLSDTHKSRNVVRLGESSGWQSSFELVEKSKDPDYVAPKKRVLEKLLGCFYFVSHQPGAAPKGIHYWGVMMMTRAFAPWYEIVFSLLVQGITVTLQVLLLAVVVETATSTTCDFDTQTGCRAGEYCSINYARGQCNDCATVLPSQSTCCPTLSSVCPTIPAANHSKYFYVYDGGTGDHGCHSTNGQVALFGQGGCIGACAMYERCISHDVYPTRCDYIVDAADRLKVTHVILIAFAATIAATTLAKELDDMDTEKAALDARNTKEFIPSRLHRYVNTAWFHIYMLLHSAALPGLMKTAIVTAVLTDLDGSSISSGVNVVFSFMALLFISGLDATCACSTSNLSSISPDTPPTTSPLCAQVGGPLRASHPHAALRRDPRPAHLRHQTPGQHPPPRPLAAQSRDHRGPRVPHHFRGAQHRAHHADGMECLDAPDILQYPPEAPIL